MQGPYDILHLIIGIEAFLLPYDNANLAKEMVEIIAKTYVAFRKEVDPLLTDGIHDAVFVHGFCCGGKVLIKADTATANLSPEMYKVYEGIPDSYIYAAFEGHGGGSLHYCGKSKSWHKEAIFDKNLPCVNYGNPEMHNIKENYAYFKDNKIAIVGWGANQEYDCVSQTIETGDAGMPIKTGVTLMCKADSVKQERNRTKERNSRLFNAAR